jgi:predicted nucleic acid-binding protein
MSEMKIYLDTSVPSAVFDLGKPERLKITKEWFNYSAPKSELYTGDLTYKEIDELLTEEKRNDILRLIQQFGIIPLKTTNKTKELAGVYIQKGAIPPTEPEDALHIAIAVVHNIPNFISWDYKHIVSKNPIRKIQELNIKAGYNLIKIGTVHDFIS